jgi:simple sugar transport system ATP-binding protein
MVEMLTEKYCIELKNITKTFGSVVANNQVNLTIQNGEIHSLLGENGSGKTTLMNMLSGIYTPNSGEIKIFGKSVYGSTPKDFIDMGIGMIHQHFKLVDVLSAKENVVLGQKGSLYLNKKKLAKEITDLSTKYGLNVNPDKKIYQMSVSEKQNVEILKVLFRGARVLILDEPTAVLTPQETKKLFEILRNMKDQGCSIIIITHKLNEVMDVSDRVTVLRKGESVATVKTADTTAKELTELMVGRPIDLSIERRKVNRGSSLLKMNQVTVLNEEKIKALNNVSFEVFEGEILGVAGVAGSGQKELCEAITGIQKVKSGQMSFKGENLIGKSPRDIFKMGISMSFIPEDRLGMGLVASMNMIDNVILKSYQKQKGFYLNRKPARELSERLIDGLEIKTPGVHHPVRHLSGGNVQKVLLGREIESNPELLITAYPVRGLDINASYKIYDLLNEQKEKGVGILFVGEDLDVLIEMCDRIMVLCEGRVIGIVNAAEADKEMIGYMMTGGTQNESV